MVPKNNTNLFVTNTEHIYFGQKQDKLSLERTGQTYFGPKPNKLILDKNRTNVFWTKTKPTYFFTKTG
jgi:hypothetical protein